MSPTSKLSERSAITGELIATSGAAVVPDSTAIELGLTWLSGAGTKYRAEPARSVTFGSGSQTTFTRGLSWFSDVTPEIASKRAPKFTVTVGTTFHSSCR